MAAARQSTTSHSHYFAFNRTSGPVTLHAFPFASVPLKLDCAVCAAADTLHHRVRIVVDPFAAMRRFTALRGFAALPRLLAPAQSGYQGIVVPS